MKKSEKIKYKGKTYYIDSNTDKSNTKLFLYTDPELKKVAKSGSGTLMVKKSDIEYKLGESILKFRKLVREEIKNILEESTYENDNQIAIFSGEEGLTYIEKKRDGTYYGHNDEFDFTAKNKSELVKKLKNWKYKLISGKII